MGVSFFQRLRSSVKIQPIDKFFLKVSNLLFPPIYRDREATLELFKKIKPTYVIHCAAIVGGLFKNMKNNLTMYQANMAINRNVLEACHEVNVTKLVSILSTCIFPDKIESYPFDESIIHLGPPHTSNEGYAYAKRMLDVESRLYCKQYNVNYVSVIPTNIYGPYDNYHLEDAHVVPALIHNTSIAAGLFSFVFSYFFFVKILLSKRKTSHCSWFWYST